MHLFTIFLFVVVFAIILLVAFNTVVNSKSFRIFLLTREKKEGEKAKFDFNQVAKNRDEIEDIMTKIKNGEEVKIPLVAFNYIYRNINKFTIIDKSGRVIFVSNQDYFEFKKKALALLKNSEEDKIDAGKDIERYKEKDEKQPYEILEYDDGTIVKKDNISRTQTIIKPDGTKIIIDSKNDLMTTETPIPEEEKEKKMDIKERKELQRKAKELEQKNKLLEEKLKNMKSEKNKPPKTLKKEILDNEDNDDFFENEIVKEVLEEEKEKKHLKAEKKEIDIKKTVDFKKAATSAPLFSKNSKSPFLKDKTENIKLDDNIKQDEVKKDIFTVTSKNLLFSFFDETLFLNTHICHKSVKDLIHFLLSYDKEVYKKCLTYDKEVCAILININYFAYKISLLISNPEQKQNFLDTFYKNIDIGLIENDFLTKFVRKINQSTEMLFGCKILFQSVGENGSSVNFKSIKIVDDEGNIYKSICLHLFLNNSFGKEFKKSLDFKKIEHSGFQVTREKIDNAKRITFAQLVQ